MEANKETALMGTKEISDAAGYSWQTLERLIKNDNFPAVKICGRWSSDKALIVEWKREKIRNK